MKNRNTIVAIFTTLALFTILSVPLLINVSQNRFIEIDHYISTAAFPKSLQVIGDSAFSETSVAVVFFHDGLMQIGDFAFYNDDYLTDVYIPQSLEYIGEKAFSNRVLIHGVEHSYVQGWADEFGLEFIIDDIWSIKPISEELYFVRLLLLFVIVSVDIDAIRRISRQITGHMKSMRPQDRPELYPIDYRFP